MVVDGDVHSVAPEVVVEFLGNIMPFNELDDETLHNVARHVKVDFFPKGTQLFTAGKTEVTSLYLIQQGGVKSSIVDDEGEVTLKDTGARDHILAPCPLFAGQNPILILRQWRIPSVFCCPVRFFLT